MALSNRVQWYLDHHEVEYEVIPHPHTRSSRETALAAHVDPDQLAKSVLLEDERGYVLAVLPSSHQVVVAELRERIGRDLELATEAELAEIFDDCEPGAVPPIGAAYGIPVLVDEGLLHVSDLYFEAGQHRDLVHLTGAEFSRLLATAPHTRFSRASKTSVAPVRERAAREERLDEQHLHVFSLRAYGAGLRRQSEYEKDGHTGMILMKTPELRVVLEAARAGTRLAEHVIHGPTTLHVLSGALDVSGREGTFRLGENEMAALPRDEAREIVASAESLFLLSLAPEHPVAPRS